MVRLSDAFPSGPKTTRPARREEQPPGVSLPEILILSDDTLMVDLIRGAIEDRGYRIRHFPSPAELQVRLKVAGRVVIIVDGRIEEAGAFLRDIATSDYPDRIVILPDTEQKELFEGIPDLRLHSLPVSAEDLLTTIEDLSTAPVTRPGTDKLNLFSSLTKPETDQAPEVAETGDDDAGTEPTLTKGIPETPAPEILSDPSVSDEIPDIPPVDEAPVTDLPSPEEPRDEKEDAAKSDTTAPGEFVIPSGRDKTSPGVSEGPFRLAGMISQQPDVPAGVKKPTIPKSSATPPPAPATVSTDGDACSGIVNLYEDAVAIMLQFMRGHRGRSEPPLSGVAQVVGQIIENVSHSSDLCLKAIQHTVEFDDADLYMANHQVNVALLAMRAGKGLKMSASDLYELTLGAMIHDIGMTQLPEGLITRQGKLDQSGYAQIKQHPAYGKQLLASYASSYPFLQTIAYQEHERLDGSGYPEGLSGKNIHLYARIIGLADTYEALTHVRPFRDHMIPFNVLQQLIRLGGQLFDKDILKAFIDDISVFPAGSYVRLNSGEICSVVAINTGYPLRPVTQVLYTADGSELEQGRTIDLKSEPMLYITGPEDPREFARG